MHLTIIKADNVVGINGQFLTIDCSDLPVDFHALQWQGPENGIEGKGTVEWNGKPKPPNTEIINLDDYNTYVEAWHLEKQRVEELLAQIAAQRAASQI